MESQYSLPSSQKPVIVFILSQINPIHVLQPNFHVTEFSSYFRLYLPSRRLLLSDFPTKIVYAFYISPFLLHARPSTHNL